MKSWWKNWLRTGDISRNPLIQVMFTVRRPTDSKFAGLELSEFGADIRHSKFDFTMIVEESNEPKLALNYSTDLFEAETIARMLGHYERLLTAVVDNPELANLGLGNVEPGGNTAALGGVEPGGDPRWKEVRA